MTDQKPSDKVASDAEADKAPDPRRHYETPEQLRDDPDIGQRERQELLTQWKQDLEQRIEAEAEGMSAADPISQTREAKLAAELRVVTQALGEVEGE
jgi:hypothetical protein